MNIISIIPARGGSKGIINKNLKLIGNIPLVAHSIKHSLKSKIISETYVSTDSTEIKMISLKYGAKVIDRPAEYASDTATTESVMKHASNYLNNDFDYIVLLQPTSPLRFPENIDESIKLILEENSDSLLSVYKNDSFLWGSNNKPINYNFKQRPRRQDKEWEYVENGSIYITNKKIFLEENSRLGGKISKYIMPKWMSFEIDTPFDFELVEFIYTTKFKHHQRNLGEIIKKLKMVIFDVDGVFTDGSVYLDHDGNEILKFSRIDGKGIELIREKNLKMVVISSEKSEIILQRMKKLKIEDVYIDIKNKLEIYEKLKEKYSLEDENICYLGDDIQDLEIIKRVGLSCCPLNAQVIVKKYSVYNSSFNGGNGFVRDVCNLILENLDYFLIETNKDK